MKRQLTTTIRAEGRAEDGSLEISGIANEAETTDSYNTRFVFTDACLQRSGLPVTLFNHDPDSPIGRAVSLTRTANGSLAIKARIEPEAVTKMGLSIGQLVEKGVLNGFSIRFDPDAEIKMGREFDTITPNYLPEISVVTLPSNAASTFSPAVRSILEQLEETPEGSAIAALYRLENPAEPEQAPEAQPPEPEPQPLEPQTPEPTRHVPDRRTARSGGPLNYADLCGKLYDAVAAMGHGSSDYLYSTYPAAIYDDYVIVCWADDNEYTQHPYTVSAEGEVTVAPDGVDVLPTWTPVAESADEAGDAAAGGLLEQSARRHQGHMDGSVPTTPQSQAQLMGMMQSAQGALGRAQPEAEPHPTTRAGAKYSKATRDWLAGHAASLRGVADDMERAMNEGAGADGGSLVQTDDENRSLHRILDLAFGPPPQPAPDGELEALRALLREAVAN